jgi:hypothetical protein
VHARVIENLIRIREIRGFALPGLVILGLHNNLNFGCAILKDKTIGKTPSGIELIRWLMCDSDVYVLPKKGA